VATVPLPTLVVVSGPPASGKTRLAHAVADVIPCPAVCRDEIKEGMVHAHGAGFVAGPGDALTVRTLPVFFDVLRVLAGAGVTLVAEAAFQDEVWRRGLEPLLDLTELRIVQCTVDDEVARTRLARSRPAHADRGRPLPDFERLSIAAPSLLVDTTAGYAPDLAEIVAFVNGR
jgi:predicted kinase